MDSLFLLLVVLLVVFIYKKPCSEYLTTKPTKSQIAKYTSEVLDNKELFLANSTLYQAKERLSWIDPITYEDIRTLQIRDKLSTDNLQNIFK